MASFERIEIYRTSGIIEKPLMHGKIFIRPHIPNSWVIRKINFLKKVHTVNWKEKAAMSIWI